MTENLKETARRLCDQFQKKGRDRGLLIAFEGPDGSGKTTQRKLFKEWLAGDGYDVVTTKWNSSKLIKPISKGAFGSVYLSKKKSTGDYYAIKVLKKADMVAKNQVTNVKAERAIMIWQGESDFVAKLYWTFSSKDYLYLVMEYLNGGDCASLVKVLGGLPEDWAKKYMAEAHVDDPNWPMHKRKK